MDMYVCVDYCNMDMYVNIACYLLEYTYTRGLELILPVLQYIATLEYKFMIAMDG